MATQVNRATSARRPVKAASRPAPAASNAAKSDTAPDASETLTDRAYRLIEEMLVTLKIAPGTLMSELELAKQLGISRTPVGEALSRLSRTGLVTVLPRRGFIATEISITQQLRMLELRREVARLVARLAALRATPAQRTELLAVARQFARAVKNGDEHEYMAADQTFHQLVAQCAQNDYAVQVLETLDSQTRRFWFAHRHQAGAELEVVAPLHAQLAAAIEQGDADKAGSVSDALCEYLERFARATLDPFMPSARNG
ncbi:MAG: GntR family transcriptional regulator [Betaproteobacteria bacterium]|jgi:DNA-binding GntR family transcriptional regulator|nr:GntR family transcriptional regulator [Betaproteobacteria bacterium]NBS47351.1 GntR family transcriptional regulator [Betaproteobacteria bacterium]